MTLRNRSARRRKAWRANAIPLTPHDRIGKLHRPRDVVRIFLLIFLASCVCTPSTLAAEEYGHWSLEPLKGGAIITLVQRLFRPDPGVVHISIADFSFFCDRRSNTNNIGVTVFPFAGTYNNQETKLPVLIELARNLTNRSYLYWEWSNGYKYIFLNQQDAVKTLIEYLRTNERNGEPFVNFLFSGDFHGRTEKVEQLLRFAVELPNFSEGYSNFEKACSVVQ